MLFNDILYIICNFSKYKKIVYKEIYIYRKTISFRTINWILMIEQVNTLHNQLY